MLLVLVFAVSAFAADFEFLAEELSEIGVFKGTFMESVPFVFDSTELPIITLYAMYIPMYIQWMRKEKDQSIFRRFVIPCLATAGAVFMVYASIVGHKMANFWYLIVFAVIMLIGKLVSPKK